MENFFKLKEHGTTVSKEVVAGITTFFAMSYIIFVNPAILSLSGMPSQAVFLATIISAAVSTLVMGLFANVPYALAPGMGLNAFFVFTVCLGMGYSWQFALTAILIEGFSKRSREQLMGRTEQNKAVIMDKGNHHIGEFVKVRITGSTSATLFGEEITE